VAPLAALGSVQAGNGPSKTCTFIGFHENKLIRGDFYTEMFSEKISPERLKKPPLADKK